MLAFGKESDHKRGRDPDHSAKGDFMNLLTVKQAAERLNISEKTIYKLVEIGHLGCVRPSPRHRTIRIPVDALAAYLESCRGIRLRSAAAAGLRHIKTPAAG